MVSDTDTATSGTASPGGWLYGRSTDLLLGAGIGYVVSIPVLVLAADIWGLDTWPVTLAALLALFVNAPHYGATILRVYEHREDRRKYALFSVWATFALFGLFAAGVHDVLVGSLLFTLYLSWAPWHFAGQNYGLAVMFLRRRGVEVDSRAKKSLYVSFVLSFVLAFLVLHLHQDTATTSNPGAPVIQFMPLGMPAGFVEVAFPLTALVYATSLGTAAALLLRNESLRSLGPAICLVLVQALWYVLPAAVRTFSGTPLNGLAFTVLGISVAHSMQYLWVSSYYAKREDPSHRLGPYLLRALFAGLTVAIVPGFIFAPELLGAVPWNMGLAMVLFAVVNLHHFLLDGAIWKLRDGRVARMLLRNSRSDDGTGPALTPTRSWFRPTVAVLGAVSLTIAGIDLWQRGFVINRAGKDVPRLVRSADWLARIGRDDPAVHSHIARLLAKREEADASIAEFQRSLELYPTPGAWLGLGEVHASRDHWPEASEAFAAALTMSPDYVPALMGSSEAWMQLGRPDLARQSLERALTFAPRSAEIRQRLRRAIAAQSEES